MMRNVVVFMQKTVSILIISLYLSIYLSMIDIVEATVRDPHPQIEGTIYDSLAAVGHENYEQVVCIHDNKEWLRWEFMKPGGMSYLSSDYGYRMIGPNIYSLPALHYVPPPPLMSLGILYKYPPKVDSLNGVTQEVYTLS